MNKHELNNQVEANVFSDELTDEALDRGESQSLSNSPGPPCYIAK